MQGHDRVEQFAAMPDQLDAEILQVLCGQRREHRPVNRVGPEDRFVLFEPHLTEPGSDIHRHPPDGCGILPRRGATA
jgi:hypothetical protein